MLMLLTKSLSPSIFLLSLHTGYSVADKEKRGHEIADGSRERVATGRWMSYYMFVLDVVFPKILMLI